MSQPFLTVSSKTLLNQFYGWQLLYYSIQHIIRKKSDLLIALAHFLITKQYNLRSIDTSSVQDLTHCLHHLQESGSELLPEHWNRDAQKYTLHYVCEGSHYVLLAKLTHRDLVINLQNWTSKRMSITCVQPDELVSCTRGKLDDCMPDADVIMERLRTDLVDPVIKGTKKVPAGDLLASATSTNMLRMRRLLGHLRLQEHSEKEDEEERSQRQTHHAETSKSTSRTYSVYRSIMSNSTDEL